MIVFRLINGIFSQLLHYAILSLFFTFHAILPSSLLLKSLILSVKRVLHFS